MKKIIFLITLFSFLSCSEKKNVLDIPLTSSSEEAKRIISRLPKFVPGLDSDGKAVRVPFSVPITFKLQK